MGNGLRERGSSSALPPVGAALRLARRRGPAYLSQLNGATAIAITKLDVLDGLDTVRIAVAYELTASAMAHARESGQSERARPVYDELPGWHQPIAGVRRLEELPTEARAYVARMEELAGCPVWGVSVGPSRAQTVLS